VGVVDPDGSAPSFAGGLDKAGKVQAASATRSTSVVTGIVDLARRGGSARLLDVIDDRSTPVLVCWINQRDAGWGARIAVPPTIC
jgi:hypothetical protein